MIEHLADFLSHLLLLDVVDMLRGGVDEECERNKEAYEYMLGTKHGQATGEANKIDGDVHSSL